MKGDHSEALIFRPDLHNPGRSDEMRTDHTLAAAVLISAAGVFTPLGASGAAVRPNVMFIVCDDLNTHVSTSGYPHISTPAFDSLAASGMTFHRAYCQYPVCGPSRASFLSGLYPQSTGVISNKADIRRTRPGTVTMPERFKQAGYWTARVGKVYHSPHTNPGERAWCETPERFKNDPMPTEIEARKQFEAKHGPVTDRGNGKAWREFRYSYATQLRDQHVGYGPSGLRDEQHKDGKNARQVAEWLGKKAHGSKPFFIACGIHKPHVPFLAPDKYFDMYPRESLTYIPTPPAFWNQAPKSAVSGRYKGFGFELGVENDSLRREYMQAYHACISFVDAQIGLVLDALKRTGHWEDTIIVLTSDHGYHLGEHFMWGKVTLFEVCDRVPLVIRVPRSLKAGATTAGASSQGLVELVDLYPTLAELCGVKAPSDLQGRSLVPMLRDPKTKGKEVVSTVVSRGAKLGKAIRTARWRYARYPDNTEELYDLENDPREWKNLVTSPERAPVLENMRKKLAEMDARAAAQKTAPLPNWAQIDSPKLVPGPGVRMVPHTEAGDSARMSPIEIKGRSAWKAEKRAKGKPTYAYFRLEDENLRNGKQPRVQVSITLLDKGNASTAIQYDPSDGKPFKVLRRIELGSSGQWRTVVFNIDDARFAGRCHGADLRLGFNGAKTDPVIAEVTVKPRR